MKRFLRILFYSVVAVVCLIWFFEKLDEALRVDAYQFCKRTPADVRTFDCEKVLTEE